MRGTGKKLLSLVIVCVALSAASLTASAQTQTTGAIQGIVYEAGTKKPIAAATITVTNEETGLLRTTIASADGLYFIGMLPPGLYTIGATHPGYENDPNSATNNFPIRLSKTNLVQPPPIVLRRIGTAPSAAPAPVVTPAGGAAGDSEAERLVNTVNATRGGNFDRRQLNALPLPGIRTFESLALLLPGVAPPPQHLGSTVGPGLGAGIGTAGQLSVNGQRARANNFTVDGSDNNDEDVGVRRQGFVALVPQSIESVQEFQISTQLWDAGMGRNTGSQLNAVSKSGANRAHGALYDFFSHSALNARNFFDYTSDRASQYPLTARARFVDGSTQVVPVLVDGQPVVQSNPSEGRDLFQRNQGGASLGFPVLHDRTFFFGSFERQDVKARQETHFAVPTVAERGFFGTGATGSQAGFSRYPATAAGDAVFSVFPFPNNPIGPYGENTFTRVLPADARGTIFSLKLDHSFKLFGPEVAHTFTSRYNFTHDQRLVPSVGGAIFSGIEPRVRTQNLSLFLSGQFTARVSNQLRGSFGRTRLSFTARRDPLTIASQVLPDDPMLLNRPLLFNLSSPFDINVPDRTGRTAFYSVSNKFDAETGLGPVGQVVVTPFSPVGLDTYLFPQARTNNTYQLADTMAVFRGAHTLKFGADVRRTQLNSFLDRNYRPQVVFGGTPDLTALLNPPFSQNLSQGGPTPGFFTGADLAALGVPTGVFQSLAIGTPDSTTGLRFWQYNFFFNDNWRVRRGLTLDYGLRYEYNTVPREVNNRIEDTFKLNLPAVDPALSSVFVLGSNGQPLVSFLSQPLVDALNAPNGPIDSLRSFLDGRRTIYDPDRNNFAPHLGFAWDPLAGSSTQAGKTVVRGGFGINYDVTLGSVVSQSRNVFPTFVPFNVDANSFFYRLFSTTLFGAKPSLSNAVGLTVLPIGIGLVRGNQVTQGFLIAPNTLNVIGVPPDAVQPILSLLFIPPPVGPQGLPSGGGLAFTLPDRRLRSPYAMQFNLQVERELSKNYLASVAYVGSRGLKLTRFRTPNGGQNSPTVPIDLNFLRDGSAISPPAFALPPLSNPATMAFSRTTPGLGAYTLFDSSAASHYHSLQTSLTRKFASGWQMTAAYTWSHAIDDVSDVFDLAGAFTLPQNDKDLRAERGSANFDLRHRFVLSTLSNVPFLSRFNSAGGAAELFLGGWQFASIAALQTGQPFTVNTSFDVNLDGNLTDRPATTSGIGIINGRQRRLDLAVRPVDLLAAAGQNGQVGRNLFRAAGVVNTDFTLIKNFRVREGHALVLRVEAFNLWNRTHFGQPVRLLEAPSFGQAVDTVLTPRQLQFALKYVF